MAAIKQIKVDGVAYDIKAKLDIDGNDITTTYVKNNGKQLSTEDFTTVLKTKLESVEDNANNYEHPTDAGYNHIPAGGSSGLILVWASDGTATWGNDKDTTYSAATDSTLGLVKKGAAVGDATVENVATLLNALLASLRNAGVIATK